MCVVHDALEVGISGGVSLSRRLNTPAPGLITDLLAPLRRYILLKLAVLSNNASWDLDKLHRLKSSIVAS